jgi:hypothetical protein
LLNGLAELRAEGLQASTMGQLNRAIAMLQKATSIKDATKAT